MSLIKCHECGGQMSSEAKACPACGAAPKKSVGLIGIVFAAIFGIIVFRVVATNETRPPAPEKTTEQRAAESERQTAEARRLATVTAMAKTLKDAMRNPPSFVLESAAANDDASVICLAYRAQNGFGGVNREGIVFAGEKLAKDATAWKKHCTDQPLIDLTKAVERRL